MERAKCTRGDSSKVEDGWLHIVSAPGDRNNPGTNPYMTVNPNTFDFTKEGYFEFTMKSNNENTNIDNSDRLVFIWDIIPIIMV